MLLVVRLSDDPESPERQLQSSARPDTSCTASIVDPHLAVFVPIKHAKHVLVVTLDLETSIPPRGIERYEIERPPR